MKINTSTLTGHALDWAVAKAEGIKPFLDKAYFEKEYRYGTFVGAGRRHFAPSTAWSQGGPIIEREKISVVLDCGGDWIATKEAVDYEGQEDYPYGLTPLIAAMRCYVASKLGDTVDVPDELC